MADRVIPVAPSVPHQSQRTTLDGVEHVLDFDWSEREARWYLRVRDASGDLVGGPIKIVSNWPLLFARRAHAGMPQGELMAVDSRATPSDPTLDELGDVVVLVYRDAADLVEDEDVEPTSGLGELGD